uniref:Uncharacterized protein n=1 Tax=Arundo donax TaxID=35708 RepID=A0A0A9C2Y0_ARUDO
MLLVQELDLKYLFLVLADTVLLQVVFLCVIPMEKIWFMAFQLSRKSYRPENELIIAKVKCPFWQPISRIAVVLLFNKHVT